MCTMLLAIFVSLSPAAASSLTGVPVPQPEVRNVVASSCEMGTLKQMIDTNRDRIFGRLARQVEKSVEADLEEKIERQTNELTGPNR